MTVGNVVLVVLSACIVLVPLVCHEIARSLLEDAAVKLPRLEGRDDEHDPRTSS